MSTVWLKMNSNDSLDLKTFDPFDRMIESAIIINLGNYVRKLFEQYSWLVDMIIINNVKFVDAKALTDIVIDIIKEEYIKNLDILVKIEKRLYIGGFKYKRVS